MDLAPDARLELAKRLRNLAGPVLVLQTPMRKRQTVAILETMIRLDDALAMLGVRENEDGRHGIQLELIEPAAREGGRK